MNNERGIFKASAACYLIEDNKVLMLKFHKKWGQVYSPPGGKLNCKESPLECVKREFEEETGLKLIEPRLKIITEWVGKDDGFIFIFVAEKYDGSLLENSEEGLLEWFDMKELKNIPQFSMNEIFNDYIFREGVFEAKFHFDENDKIEKFYINKI